MGTRLELQAKFEAISGVKKVYFQPPNETQMVYPCIRYNLSDIDAKHADGLPYTRTNRYQVIVMDRNADTTIHVAVGQMPRSRFNRFYEKDGLNHFVYELYF